MRIGNDAYRLVAFVLDEKLGAGLKQARHHHFEAHIAMHGVYHCLVHVGNEVLLGSRGELSAGALAEDAGIDKH